MESDLTIKQYLDDFSDESKQLVLKLIQEGKKARELAPEISDKALEVYIDIFQNYVLHLGKEAINDVEHSSKLADEINFLFLNGMLPSITMRILVKYCYRSMKPLSN